MIKFVSGDFFDYEADIRINTVNCVGVMGAGVALLFKKEFPKMFKEYYTACKKNEVEPGKPHVWIDRDLFSELTIINFPTKIHWKNPSKYEYIEKGLLWLNKFLQDKNNLVVTLPALGCGHGGLDWEIVKEMICNHLGDSKAKILVFEPSSSTKMSKNTDVDDEVLIKNNIIRLLPSDDLYPKKLLGCSSLEIFIKGNCNLLREKSIALMINPKPSDREINALKQVLYELPRNGFTFFLGLNNSKEIDLAKEILSNGFKAVFFIPQGILSMNVRKDLLEFWDYNRLALISTTDPNQAWKKYESYKALKLRLKLANIVLINNLDIDNISQFKKDVKHSDNKVFYINYWNKNLAVFDNLLAQRVGISPETERPNILPILQLLEKL